MKYKIHILAFIFLLSCNKISNNVESSFGGLNKKLVEFIKVENQKFKNLYKQINAKKPVGNSAKELAFVYEEITEFNRVIDSLLTEVNLNENRLDKELIVQKFNLTKSDLKTRLSAIEQFKSKTDLDSLLQESDELEILPNFTLVTEMLNGQLNGILAGELALMDLDKASNPTQK